MGAAIAPTSREPVPRVADTVFGLLFECGFEAAFVVDRRDHAVIAANGRLEELLERTRNELCGTDAGVLLAPDPRVGRDVTLLDRPGHYEDVGLVRGDGYSIYVELTVAHVEHPELGPVAACLARDTTERRDLERELLAKHSALHAAHGELTRLVAELRATRHTLEERNHEIARLAGQVAQVGWRAAIGELAAGIAHHLNNPVAALTSTLRTLNLRLAGEPRRDDQVEIDALMQRARNAAARIEDQVAAVVRMHRAGALDVAPRRLDLAHELDTALAMLAGRLGAIELRRDYPHPLAASVAQEALHHVLASVLDDAVSAMAGAGVLEVSVVGGSDAWIIAIADTGAGLGPDARPFEPMAGGRGTGPGLATAHRLARSWGGDLRNCPRPHGARFEIAVPAAPLVPIERTS